MPFDIDLIGTIVRKIVKDMEILRPPQPIRMPAIKDKMGKGKTKGYQDQ